MSDFRRNAVQVQRLERGMGDRKRMMDGMPQSLLKKQAGGVVFFIHNGRFRP